MTAEEAKMLAFAALTYRGFGAQSDDAIRAALVPWLERLVPVLGRWELVWGPASYRSRVSLVDDAMMFVVRSLDEADRYVIAIRGTNPVSAFDWLFGDLLVATQVRWPSGDPSDHPDAKVSLSSFLGLGLLHALRATGPRAGLASRLVRRLRRMSDASLVRVSEAGLSIARERAADLRERMAALDRRRLRRRNELGAQITALRSEWRSRGREVLGPIDTLIDQLEAATAPQRDRLSTAIVDLLVEGAKQREELQGGTDLTRFLTKTVSRARGQVDVAVTGHSKGGALAPTLALWLAETQGIAGGWDPSRHASVRAFSYAGPTAGNAEFAAHSDRIIGANCHRIWNTKDVVPHAWEPRLLEKVPTLYEPAELPGVDLLVSEIIEETRDLDYSHIGLKVTSFEGRPQRQAKGYLAHLIHQHLDAYLEAAALGDRMSAVQLFA